MGADRSELQRACGKTAKSWWPGRFLPPPLGELKGLLEGVGWGGDWDGGEEQWDGEYAFPLWAQEHTCTGLVGRAHPDPWLLQM